MRRLAFAAVAIPLALAACSGGDADSDGDGAITGDEMAREMAQGPNISMEPGEWEQSVSFTELDMPGAPEAMKDMMRQSMSAKVTSTTCLTADQVDNPGAEFFAGKGQGSCSYDEFDRSGSHIKLSMTCADEGGTKNVIAMEGDFTPTAYTFDIDTTLQGGEAGSMAMKGKVSAKRLGECPA
jgi:hypothetical protein